ncbi:hypothetical protein GQ457_09G018330 [Hibiscus cannabinus]
MGFGPDQVHEPNRFINKKVNPPSFYFIFFSSNERANSQNPTTTMAAAQVSRRRRSIAVDHRFPAIFSVFKHTPVKLSSSSFTLSEWIFEMNSPSSRKWLQTLRLLCCRSNHPAVGSTWIRDIFRSPATAPTEGMLSGSQPPTSPLLYRR